MSKKKQVTHTTTRQEQHHIQFIGRMRQHCKAELVGPAGRCDGGDGLRVKG